jgi:shikimate 5-dehydrogenase
VNADGRKRFGFVGVTTGRSAIMRIFPRWADYLGLDGYEIVGHDVPIEADPQTYRDLVSHVKADPLAVGALVTTHKIDLFSACSDLFDEIDPQARLCGETSCLSKRNGTLVAHAKDPISAGKALAGIIPSAYWQNDAHVVCLGAGGSGIAITLHLLTRDSATDRPNQIVVVDRTTERLESMQRIHTQVDSDVATTYVHNADPRLNDQLVAALPPGSLVINATGMGKDSPGSPLTDAGLFPSRALVWELNYRGELDFMQQAQRQAASRGLTVHDGWTYFIYGWTSVMEEVFDLQFTAEQIADMSQIAFESR